MEMGRVGTEGTVQIAQVRKCWELVFYDKVKDQTEQISTKVQLEIHL